MSTAVPASRVRRRAELALLVTTVFWGLSFPLSKAVALLHQELAPDESGWFITVSTLWPRFAVAMVLLVPLAGRALFRITRVEFLQGAGLAAFASGGFALQVEGLRFTEASTSAFLSQCYVVLLPVVVFGRARRWPPLRFVASTLLVIAGVAVLADVDWRTMRIGRGELITILSTVFFAGQVLWLERGIFRNNRAIPVTAVMCGLMAALFAVVAGFVGSEPVAMLVPVTSAPWMMGTLALAVVCTFGALTLMNTFQPFLNAAEAGLIYATEPVWASLMALFLPAWLSSWGGLDYRNEQLGWMLVCGGGLILAANVIIQVKPPVAPAPQTRARPLR